MSRMRVGRRTVEISDSDKVLFPDAGITEGALAEFYRKAARLILPYTTGRPITMERYPDGLDADGFYEKKAPAHFPDWINRVELRVKEGGSQRQIACDKTATLVYLADQACITPHVWLSRSDNLDHPDRLIFDLDPAGNDLALLRRAARLLRDLLEELDLPVYLMLTGSRGVHLWTPLDRSADFDTVRGFASRAAGLLARRHPKELTVQPRKDKRRGRLFLDVARNAYGQTAVPPYAVRARPGATVAAPIEWDELSHSAPDRYTIANILRRVGQKGDPWKGMMRKARSLKRPGDRLEAIASAEEP